MDMGEPGSGEFMAVGDPDGLSTRRAQSWSKVNSASRASYDLALAEATGFNV